MRATPWDRADQWQPLPNSPPSHNNMTFMYGVLAIPNVVVHSCPGYCVKEGTPVGMEHWAGKLDLFGAFSKVLKSRMRLRPICFGVIPNHPVTNFAIC